MESRNQFLTEVKSRLEELMSRSKRGFRVSGAERHRLQGFMQAGEFLGLCQRPELSRMMEEVHHQVYGQSLAQRREAQAPAWPDEAVDYAPYDAPAYERSR